MILWHVEQVDYSSLMGLPFNTVNSADFYYKSINNPGLTIFGQNIWLKQEKFSLQKTWLNPESDYIPEDNIFDGFNFSFDTISNPADLDSLTFLRFTSHEAPSNYLMVLPKIVDNPFNNLTSQFNQYGYPEYILTSSFDPSQDIETYQALGNDQYQPQVLWKNHFENYTIRDLLEASVRCISECNQNVSDLPIVVDDPKVNIRLTIEPPYIKTLLNHIFPTFPADTEIELLTYESLIGYRFALPESMSGNVYYTNHNNSGKTILAEHIWWKQLNVSRSTYSVFQAMNVPTQSTETQVGVDTLNFIRFQPKNEVNSTYWMILPKIIDNPFMDFTQKSEFNISESETIGNFYKMLANDQYSPSSIKPADTFGGYTLHYLLNTTVRCISECSDRFITQIPTEQDIPEGSHILTFLVLGVICCARIIKHSIP